MIHLALHRALIRRPCRLSLELLAEEVWSWLAENPESLMTHVSGKVNFEAGT